MTPPIRRSRQQAGKLKTERGNELESFLENQRRALAGRVDYEKRPSPLKMMGVDPTNPRFMRCVRTKASGVDFDGTLDGGRAVYFEAKSTGVGTRFDLKLISDDQLALMARRAKLGAACFIYVRATSIGLDGQDFILPVNAEGKVCGYLPHHGLLAPLGDKSISWAALEPWAVGRAELWLDACERIGEAGLWL